MPHEKQRIGIIIFLFSACREGCLADCRGSVSALGVGVSGCRGVDGADARAAEIFLAAVQRQDFRARRSFSRDWKSSFLHPRRTSPISPPPPHAEMSPAKTADAAVTSPKPRKSGGKPGNAAPAKSPPPSKAANHGPAAPATAKRKRHRHRGPRNKNKDKARKDVEPAEDAGDEAAVAAKKKKASLERKPKESSKDALAPRPNWKLSPALGGRFLQLDPVFARNEKYGICNPPDPGD